MFRFLLLMFALPLFAFAEEPCEELTVEMALFSVEFLRSNPTSKDAPDAAAVIARYAQESSDVLVVIGPNYLPWELGMIDSDAEPLLLAAFVAGNIEYQIENGVKEHRPLEGILTLVHVYDTLRSSGKVDEIPKLEEWLLATKVGREIDVPPPE